MKKTLVITTIVILLVVLTRFLITKNTEAKEAKQRAAMSTLNVTLDEVKEMETYKSIEVPGRVQSMNKVDLIARIDGYLQKKHFSEGDYVKKGQVLFTIEQTQYINAINQAQANVENAKANLYKAQRDYDRGAQLVQKDYISKSTYDGLLASRNAAKASLKSAQAALAEAKRNYSYTTIKAPVDGRIGSLQIQEGNYVNASSGPLATITKFNPIYVKYSVDSKKFEDLRKEDFIPKKGKPPIKVDVILPNGEIYNVQGVQDFWDNQISSTTGTLDFRATFKNNENILIPGDFVKVKIYSNQKEKSLVVPQDLVLQDSKGRYIYYVDKDNLAQVKYFNVKGQFGTYWIIQDGLNLGEKYISTNITKLMPKMPVKVEGQEDKRAGRQEDRRARS